MVGQGDGIVRIEATLHLQKARAGCCRCGPGRRAGKALERRGRGSSEPESGDSAKCFLLSTVKVAENDAPHTCSWMTILIEFIGTTSDTDTPKVIRPVLWWTQDRNIMARERLNAPVQNTTIPNTL